jgi:hypothetical protein
MRTAVSLMPQRALSSRRVNRTSLLTSAYCSIFFSHQFLDDAEHSTGLRRQLIERAAEHVVRERVCARDVGERYLDVLDRLAPPLEPFDLALVLVQERNRVDQRQVLRVISPCTSAVVEERELLGIGIDDREWSQESLHVAVQPLRRLGLARRHEPG